MALSHSKNLGFNLQQIKTLLNLIAELDADSDVASLQAQIDDLEARVTALETP